MNIQTWILQSKLKRSDATELLFFVLAPQTTLDANGWVLANGNVDIQKKLLAKLNKLSLRRLAQEPMQYILGYAEFGELKLKVNKYVLIPRQETLELINLFQKHIIETYSLLTTHNSLSVADIGTGSGAIAITITEIAQKNNMPIDVIAIDISAKALSIAKQNSAKLIESKIQNLKFLQGSLLEPIAKPIDIIIANLPYIPSAEMSKLDSSVKDFEPLVALIGGEKGLDLIYNLINQAEIKLNPKGKIFLEIWDEHTKNDFVQFANFKTEIYKDSFGKTRFAVLTKI